MSDSVNQARAFEVLTATPIRTRRTPRDWPNAEKALLIAETMLPGANVSAIARAEGLDPSQLYGWRRKALASGSVVPLSKEANERVSFARVEAVASSPVEIVSRLSRQSWVMGWPVRSVARWSLELLRFLIASL